MNRDNVERMLLPEVEAGSISWHDFERTKQYASVNRKLWPTATAVLTATSAIYYGYWHRKQPKLSVLIIAPFAYVVGLFPGLIGQVLAARRFHNDLEDPRGVKEAITRRIRLSGDFPNSPQSKGQEDTSKNDSQSGPLLSPVPYIANYISGIVMHMNGQGNAPQDRWAELRKASIVSTTSTWDIIRQTHERSAGEGQEAEFNTAEQDDNQTEQAKFDALLEAERKMSS
ncbi:hypothetical protein K439DRAFT_631423 [Ramaria rubella]|nr:hypothetical protein K439DRAFT_631423 [Ramaria rubella]